MASLGSLGAISGGIVAVIAMALLAAFFATGRQSLGRANDAAAALMGLLLLPVPVNILGVYPDAEPVMVIVTAIGLGAMAVLIVASGLTATGRLSIAQMTAWQGGSFGGLFLWVAGTSAATNFRPARRDPGGGVLPRPGVHGTHWRWAPPLPRTAARANEKSMA